MSTRKYLNNFFYCFDVISRPITKFDFFFFFFNNQLYDEMLM